MPMLGVMRAILEDEWASISGDDAFFSVARTMPFVASRSQLPRVIDDEVPTFDAKSSDALVYSI
jgi:hypothetical protein